MTVPSVRQLAPLLGISHTMLNRQLKRGKFKAGPDGRFDVEKVRAALKATADLDQPSQAKKLKRNARSAEYAESEDGELEPGDENSFRIFNRAKARKEQVRAKHAELDLKQRMGELIDAKEASEAWGKAIMAARNRALLMPGEVAAKLAVESSVAACEEIVKGAIYEMLSDLAGQSLNA